MERAILESRMRFIALLKLIVEEWEEDVLVSNSTAFHHNSHSHRLPHAQSATGWLPVAAAKPLIQRRHLRLFSHSIHDFWPKVDEELEDLHDAGPEDFLECDLTFDFTSLCLPFLIRSMKLNFEEDIAIYGDPVESTHCPSSDTFNDSCLKDLKALSPLAPKIQRVVARKRANKAKKRKHRDEPEDEDEEPATPSPAENEEGNGASGDGDDGH
ncbi:hypothetical protein B0H13DRAFT_1873535 [Mycena leptocephala]|nr:hypothetical protein B0H13DRAFT_1873535 [Mycena leptocephala]